ncbi:hypothetical protein DPMN_108634 [Dreissena polymorpha]|uniref:Uncharacterized protein n=1 Tax=Dreissena polymorpha TaxID=45954 RepID=A0A9D4K975_DREPO|nr:hypothetical protein DPMN_108634 [Dreissena polymorpha]
MTCRRTICFDRGTPTERPGSKRCQQADGDSDLKINRPHSLARRRSENSKIAPVCIRIRKTPQTKHRRRSRSCCCRGRTCCRRQTSAARSDRLRHGLQKDRTDDSEDGIVDIQNSLLDKVFLQHDSRLFDDRRRSIVDVLNTGYIASTAA